jgi:DNA-directed RNA polymerase subunit alpha
MNNAFEDVATMITENRLGDAAAKLDTIAAEGEDSKAEKLYLAGWLLERQNDWQGASAKYREALEVDPDHSDSLFHLAYLADLHGDDETAIQMYERCAHDPPAHVNALMNLAILYEDQGRFEDAYKVVERVVKKYPNHVRARLVLKDIESSLTMYYDEEREMSREKRDAILDTPVSDFELSVRSRNCLKQMNIHCLGDLLKITEPKLLAYKNFGETSLNEIKAMLAQKGLRLGQYLDDGSNSSATASVEQPVIAAGEPNLLNRSVAELELSVRSRKCLQRLGISTLQELVARSEPELLSIKNFGQTSLMEIKRRLAEVGLSLRDSPR